MNDRADVVLVGAGIAGLGAARMLAESGLSVLIIEARPGIGGRIFTVSDSNLDLPIELGAEFIHGLPPELWALINEAGLATWELTGRERCYRHGKLADCESDDNLEALEKLKRFRGRDLSFAQYIARQPKASRARWLTGYIESFNAADARIIGVASLAKQEKADEEIEGHRIFRVVNGYSRVTNFLLQKFQAAGGRIHLATTVKSIAWKPQSVALHCISSDQRPMTVEAFAAVITVPLGVLQSGRLRFDPPPLDILEHATRMAMGSARRITLCFKEAFWNQKSKPPVSFIFSQNELPPTWWTPAPLLAPVLTGWVGGPRAADPAIQDDQSLLAVSLRTLAKPFSTSPGLLRRNLQSWQTHSWQQDPFALGAYSYVPAGALDAPDHMTHPVAETLFFAGEHTDNSGHWGTVHGALRSGYRAARQVLRSWSKARRHA